MANTCEICFFFALRLVCVLFDKSEPSPFTIAKRFFSVNVYGFVPFCTNVLNDNNNLLNRNAALAHSYKNNNHPIGFSQIETGQQLLAKIKAERLNRVAALARPKKEKELPPIKPQEIPFEIPENWVWCRLGELSLYSEAGSSFKCEEIPVSNGEWGVIKVSAVSWDVFLEDKNKVYSKNQPDDISAKINIGDFLISRANTSELVGKSVVVKSITKKLLLSDKTIRFKFSNFVSTDYVHLCNNNTKYARDYYALMGTGSSPSMKNITREHMRNLLIPLPPLSEQNRIVQKLDEIMQYCNELEASIKQSASQNEKLLQQVLREALRKEPVVV